MKKWQAGAELGQAQLKLELSFTWFKIFCINPLSPGVLDPGNYPGGGPQDPQLYFAFFGLFYAP